MEQLDLCIEHQCQLDMLCQDCNKLICIECSISKSSPHKLHEILTIKSIVASEKIRIQSTITNYQDLCTSEERLVRELESANEKNKAIINQCNNPTESNQLLLSTYITSNSLKCRLHDLLSDAICTDCKEFVCMKCLLDAKCSCRSHTLKSKEDIINSITEKYTADINKIHRKINKRNEIISSSKKIILEHSKLLVSNDADIIKKYISGSNYSLPTPIKPIVTKSLQLYSANLIKIRDELKKNNFEILLDYTGYDLKCMTNRFILGVDLVSHILGKCTDLKIIYHFVDNIIDVNYNTYKRDANKYYDSPPYDNIFSIIYQKCNSDIRFRILEYVFDRIDRVPDNIWNCGIYDPEIKLWGYFFGEISFDFMVRIIKEKKYQLDGLVQGAFYRSFFDKYFGCYLKNLDDIEKKQYYVIDNIVDLNSYEKYGGYTLFQYIIINSKPNIIKYVIDKGIDLEYEYIGHSMDGLGSYTPISFTISDNKIEAMKVLITAGANIDHVNEKGNRPIHFAVKYGNSEAIKLLIAAGANLENANENGNRPIHGAVIIDSNSKIDIIKLLIAAGVNTKCKNNEGLTPIDIIKNRKDPQSIVSLFD